MASAMDRGHEVMRTKCSIRGIIESWSVVVCVSSTRRGKTVSASVRTTRQRETTNSACQGKVPYKLCVIYI